MASKYDLERRIGDLNDQLRAERERTRQKQLVINALLELEPAYKVFVTKRPIIFGSENDYSQLLAFAKLKREDSTLAEYEARLEEAKNGSDVLHE